MSLALPGSGNIFSSMQNALSNMSGTRVTLNKGVHHALEDFRWMHDNIASCPTRIAELVPLDPVAEGHHDASGSGAGGIWFPSAMLVPCSGSSSRFFGITSSLTISSNDLSQRPTPMALSPTQIWSLLVDCCTRRLSHRPLISPSVLSYQKEITQHHFLGVKR
eukprot:CCRYP_000734-RA/>CCRYP_000734-RA protein AED:0.45 eAED:0.45 QI:0/0/0/1/0/0/2/0/162